MGRCGKGAGFFRGLISSCLAPVFEEAIRIDCRLEFQVNVVQSLLDSGVQPSRELSVGDDTILHLAAGKKPLGSRSAARLCMRTGIARNLAVI